MPPGCGYTPSSHSGTHKQGKAGSERWRIASERFETPDEAGGPHFLRCQRRAPDREDLRALVDALEAFFGFGNGLNRRDPESFGQRRVQRRANSLPAVFHAQDGRRERAVEAKIRMAAGSFKEAVRLGGRQKVDNGFNSNGHRLFQKLFELELDFARDFKTVLRWIERKAFEEQEPRRRWFRFIVDQKRVRAKELGAGWRGILDRVRAAGKRRILAQLESFVVRLR